MPTPRSTSAPLADKPLPAPPALAVRAVLALRRTLLRAADACVPPAVAVLERSFGGAVSHVIGELARLKVADLVAEQPLTAAEIAAKTGTNADAMMRTLRAAASIGFFERDAQGRFKNTRLSSALRSGDRDSVRAFAEYFGSRSNMMAWTAFPETLRTGKNGFELVHGKTVWEWFDEHPHERETFAHAMMTLTLFDAPGIAATYPFGEVKRLCDVGGGRGTLLSEILVRHPHLHAVLCDAPGVLDSARVLLGQRGVASRVELVPGSFFDHVPKGCDAYLMKNVLHDWDDERCIKILKNCRAAMEPGQKLLLVEQIIEETSDDPGTFSDLQMMMVCCEGRERSRGDFARLLAASGFQSGRVLDAPTLVAIIEGIAA